MSIQFRQAKRADLSLIVAIYNEAVTTKQSTADVQPVTVAQREAWFTSFNPLRFPLWMIENEGRVAGFVGLEPYSDRAGYRHVAESALYLASDQQGQHIGSQAVDWIARQAPKLGLTTVIARIFGHNTASRKLFTKAGYAQWGHLPEIAEMPGFTADLEVYGRHFTTTD
ncbi:GNAT family N-acetyltransferase [Levilactobacillus lindianensis]|uniref:GNAT family N-acetyltransferase n=1 Tax=Levilactobacillus lindianensis TaxID=2486018 RepID=UPI000F74B503|nr:GNAT family N-acetyltransferase [Levilactobacillus lindianensis]